jgi:predicted nucleic acid-binding protein
VVDFVEAQSNLIVSAIVFHEMILGLSLMAEGRKKTMLSAGVEAFRVKFEDRIVTVDHTVAVIAGQLRADEIRAGFEADGMDALIAACAIVSTARIATRNTKDFLRMGIELVNPWTE